MPVLTFLHTVNPHKAIYWPSNSHSRTGCLHFGCKIAERKENKSNSICQRAKFCLQVTGPELKIYGGWEWSDIILEPHPVGPQGPKGQGHFLALQVFPWLALLTGLSIPQKPRRQWFLGQLQASAVFYELFINFHCWEPAISSPFLQC